MCDIISMAQELCGYEIEVKVNPAFVRDNEIKKLVGSTSKLRKQIGIWSAPSFKETMAWMLGKETTASALYEQNVCMTEILD